MIYTAFLFPICQKCVLFQDQVEKLGDLLEISFLQPIKWIGTLEKDKEKELLGYFLPEGTLEYFDITHFVKDKEGLVFFLEEKNIPPTEYAGQTLHSKGFYPEVRVQDFPIRENKVELSIKCSPVERLSPVTGTWS